MPDHIPGKPLVHPCMAMEWMGGAGWVLPLLTGPCRPMDHTGERPARWVISYQSDTSGPPPQPSQLWHFKGSVSLALHMTNLSQALPFSGNCAEVGFDNSLVLLSVASLWICLLFGKFVFLTASVPVTPITKDIYHNPWLCWSGNFLYCYEHLKP